MKLSPEILVTITLFIVGGFFSVIGFFVSRLIKDISKVLGEHLKSITSLNERLSYLEGHVENCEGCNSSRKENRE